MRRTKLHARDHYLITVVDGIWCNVRKFTGSQLQTGSYRVKQSECLKVHCDAALLTPPTHCPAMSEPPPAKDINASPLDLYLPWKSPKSCLWHSLSVPQPKSLLNLICLSMYTSEWVSELVYVMSLLNSQGLMSDGPGAGQWHEGRKGTRHEYTGFRTLDPVVWSRVFYRSTKHTAPRCIRRAAYCLQCPAYPSHCNLSSTIWGYCPSSFQACPSHAA